MKKLISLTLLTTLIISMCIPSFAYTNLSANTNISLDNAEYVMLHGGSE